MYVRWNMCLDVENILFFNKYKCHTDIKYIVYINILQYLQMRDVDFSLENTTGTTVPFCWFNCEHSYQASIISRNEN